MKGLILFALTAMASTAFGAQQIFVETKLIVNGKIVGTPQLLALEGEEASIEVGDVGGPIYRMSVLATLPHDELVKDEINMKFQVSYSDAQTHIHFSPHVLAKSGAEATIRMRQPGEQKVEMKVVATRR